MASGASESRLKQFLHSAREYLTDWAIAGTVITLTGFAPEHWFADLFSHLSIPEGIRHGWLQGFDLRIGLVALGVAIIAWDVLRRSKLPKQGAVLNGGHDTRELAQTRDLSSDDQGKEPQATEPATLALPDKPSIAVLPFQNLSGDPEQEYFTDGITEDIITELSRFHSLFVIARNSSFTYKGKAVDIKQVGRELGVRYVLEGSIRRVANRIRVTGQLIDALTGTHLWAEKYDRVLEDIFVVQEEVTRAIVSAMAPHIDASEAERMRGVRPTNLSAYELAMRARSAGQVAFGGANLASREEAIRFAREAIAIDPRCSAALRTLAFVQWQNIYFNTTVSVADTRDEGVEAATRAIAIDSGDHLAHLWRGSILFLTGKHEAGLADMRRAQELNPNDALTLACLGFSEANSGDPRKGVEYATAALRLSPRDPSHHLFLNCLAWACFAEHEYAKAAECAQRSASEAPNMPASRLCLVVSCVGLAEIVRAKSEYNNWRPLAPEMAKARLAGQWPTMPDPDLSQRATTFLRIAAGLQDPGAADGLR